MSSRLSGPDWSHPPLPFLETALRHLPPPWTLSCTSLPPPPLPSAHLSFNRKALKVVDLKDILTKAGVAIGKANKPDLIAKILASSEAVAVYNKNYGGAPADSVQNVSAAYTGVQEQLVAVCSFPSPLFVCSTVPSCRVQPQPPKACVQLSCSFLLPPDLNSQFGAIFHFTITQGYDRVSSVLQVCLESCSQTGRRHFLILSTAMVTRRNQGQHSRESDPVFSAVRSSRRVKEDTRR